MGIANRLTLVRLGLCPVLVLVIYLGGPVGYALALVLTILVETTDVLDGRLARSRRETSDFGRLADPLSDVLAHLSLFLCFLWQGYAHLATVVVVLYREMLIAYLRTAAARAGVVLASRPTGKVKTVIYAGASLIILALINFDLHVDLLTGCEIRLITNWLMAIVAMMSLISGFEYIRGNWTIVRELLRPPEDEDGKA